jgi:hypothetical protein
VVGDLPDDFDPEDTDVLGVLKARVARSFAVQQTPPSGTPAWKRTPHFSIPASPPSSRPVSFAGERSFHLGLNKPAERPARTFDRYAASKQVIAPVEENLAPPSENDHLGPASYDNYAAGHGGETEQYPDHYTNLSLDIEIRARQWDAVESHERSLRVSCEPGQPRLAIYYERAPELFDRAASLTGCAEGLRQLIAKEQSRVAAGKTLPPRKQKLGVEWIDEGARGAYAWLTSLAGWNADTDPARRLSRLSEGRGVLTHVSGEFEYPAALATHADARHNIRVGIAQWLNEQPVQAGDQDDPGIVPVALFDHLPDGLNDRRNIHGHFIIGTRRVHIADDGSLTFASHKVDLITRQGFVKQLRTKFAELANIELSRIGANHRLHPGTHAEMGIDGTAPNQKLFGRATVLERAGVSTTSGLSNDLENWRRKFLRARTRRDASLANISQETISDASKAMLRRAAELRYEAEEIGLLIGMTVSRAKRTARFAPAYADAAKRAYERDGWLERGRAARVHLKAVEAELADERRAVTHQRREAARLEREARGLAERERASQRVAAQALSVAHRAVDIIVRTPLLLTISSDMYCVEPQDDPDRLVEGIDLSTPDIQRRLAGQHAAQTKALARVRAFIDRHGHDALFDDARINGSDWMRRTIVQWRSSPLLAREKNARRERATEHRAMLIHRQKGWPGREEQDIERLVEEGRVRLVPETAPTPRAGPADVAPANMHPVIFGASAPAKNSAEENVWPRWRPGALQPIPSELVARWRAEGAASFATDIAGFDHVLAARPGRHVITDGQLGPALGGNAVWLTDLPVSQRLTAVWLYQEMTREDLIAARQHPHVMVEPAPPLDPSNALCRVGLMADRARHAGDQRLVAMFERLDGREVASPPAHARGNRLVRTALAAIRAREDLAVCRILADAAIAQPAWRILTEFQVSENDAQLIWSASSMPGKGIHRRGSKLTRRRGYPALSPPHWPGRGRS